MKKPNDKSKWHPPSTTKLIVWWLVLNGTAWVWCSYYLAYAGREEIAEALSKVIVTEILGVVITYCIKALVENISKNKVSKAEVKSDNTNNERDC